MQHRPTGYAKVSCGPELGNKPMIYWLSQTAEQIPPNNNWLCNREQDVLAGFRFAKRRSDWLLGRWTAKRAVCAFKQWSDACFPELEIRASQSLAPEAYWNGCLLDLTLSISHSHGRSLVALSRPEFQTGCDLEWIEPREGNFGADYFTPDEIIFLRTSPLEKDLSENLIWSAKESVLKSLRTGLSRDTRSVNISPESGGGEGIWARWTGRCLESGAIYYGWWQTGQGYIYTVVSAQPAPIPNLLQPSILRLPNPS